MSQATSSSTTGSLPPVPVTGLAVPRVGAPPQAVASAKVARPDLSVVLPVGDDEDHVGHQVRALAKHLGSLRLSFEIIALDAGSRDASLPVLQLLKAQIPELRLSSAQTRKRAIVRGMSEARGDVVLLVDPAAPRQVPLGPVGWAIARLGSGRDAVIVRDRYVVAHRMAALPVAIRALRAPEAFERAFERHAGELRVEVVGPARVPTGLIGVRRLLGPVFRFLAA